MQAALIHRFDISDDLRPFATVAAKRLGYLQPNWALRIEDATVIAEVPAGESKELVVREISYALYREKILSETLVMRRELLRMVSRS